MRDDMEQASDAELAGRAALGDDGAFAELVRRYQHAVYEMSCRMLRNRDAGFDAAQEIFLKAHRALGTYDASRKFSTWVLAIARNHCIDEIRRAGARPISGASEIPASAAADGPDPARALEAAQTGRVLEDAVASLPDLYREAVVLYHFQELSYAEAAEVSSVPIGTYMARLHRARRMLREALRGVLGDDEDE